MPMRRKDAALPDEIQLLARQFAHALVREVRAQLCGETVRTIGGPQPSLPAALRSFDDLPDSALVDIKVVAALLGCSVATAWRRVAAGILPEPERIVGTTRWRVGKLRAVRAASSVTRIKKLRPSKAEAVETA